MTIVIKNQTPVQFYTNPRQIIPLINPAKDDYASLIEKDIRARLVDPLYQGLNNQNVTIEDHTDPNNPIDIDADTLNRSIQYIFENPTLDVNLEDQLAEIYRQSMRYHTPNDWLFNHQWLNEALSRHKLPLPSNQGRLVTYDANMDVIPAAKGFLAQNDDAAASEWFANIGAFAKDKPFNDYLMVTVQNDDAFNELKQQFDQHVQQFTQSQGLSQTTTKHAGDFNKLTMGNQLSIGLFLPDLSDTVQPLSFGRLLMYSLGETEALHPGRVTVQPTIISQLYLPTNIIILNLEEMAHAQASAIKKDWQDLAKAFQFRKQLNFISNKKLMTAKSVNHTNQPPAKSSSHANGQTVARIKAKKFSSKPVTSKETINAMAYVINKHITKRRTENQYKTKTSTFMRANRRQPDNIDIPGQTVKVNYRPDVHIYLDTSGSISESMYKDAVGSLIQLTKKLNSNLYITSFSHYVSQTTLLNVKNKSAQAIYKEFLDVPKVTGGTDFEHVWQKIDLLEEHNKKAGKSYQLNFIITDFGYDLSRDKQWDAGQASLKQTYYVPISTDQREWKQVIEYAEDFKRQMIKAGDRNVRRRMLM